MLYYEKVSFSGDGVSIPQESCRIASEGFKGRFLADSQIDGYGWSCCPFMFNRTGRQLRFHRPIDVKPPNQWCTRPPLKTRAWWSVHELAPPFHCAGASNLVSVRPNRLVGSRLPISLVFSQPKSTLSTQFCQAVTLDRGDTSRLSEEGLTCRQVSPVYARDLGLASRCEILLEKVVMEGGTEGRSRRD